MYKIIGEGKAIIKVPSQEKVSKNLPVFYNPVMQLNRDITIAFLKTIEAPLKISLPLAGTGVRGVRIALETHHSDIVMNDLNPEAVKIIKQNLKLNKLKLGVENREANQFLLENKGFDFIDIDPFGSPNPFLDSAIKRLSRNGFLAVTATDIAPLAGTFPKACKRKYWARPLRNELMHEVGLRILIRKVQLVAAQYEKALIPIISYSKDHYFRVIFGCFKGKQKVDALLTQHEYLLYCDSCLNREISRSNQGVCSCGSKFDYAGPLYIGGLNDSKVLKEALRQKPSKFLKTLYEESLVDSFGFFNIHKLVKNYKIKFMPTMDSVLKSLDGSRTHFVPEAVKTPLKITDLVKLINRLG